MPNSIYSSAVQSLLDSAQSPGQKLVSVDGQNIAITVPFPSPADWRDHWIYFLMVDRFNRPDQPPKHHYDANIGEFQGGTLEGVRQKLGYLQRLGVGAIWLTPILKNCAYINDTFHGYGIQDFLEIEPRLVSNPADPERELQQLIDEAHARGMYIIFDIVLNHAGDVFAYENQGSFHAAAEYSDQEYHIRWRNSSGEADPRWRDAPNDQDPELDSNAAVWPKELRQNKVFRRKGKGGELGGDFESLKELVTGESQVRNTLIRAYQYLIAKFDIDGYRIDTLKYIEKDFARIFGNAIREYALSIGKKNFFTFGEVYDDEYKIAQFIGRNATDNNELIGVDAALDFPLLYHLPSVVKGFQPPSVIAEVYALRKKLQQNTISSHGDASRYFVTFIDNHDMNRRFYFRDTGQPDRYDQQVSCAVAGIFSLLGIPCLYYGTEQGLHGAGNSDRAVREALWGQPDAFSEEHLFYRTIAGLSKIREAIPALRYGRQYFRPVSGDRARFGLSNFPQGILAFSRILNDHEVLITVNTHSSESIHVYVLVDYELNTPGARYQIAWSNQHNPENPGAINEISDAQIQTSTDEFHRGNIRALKVHLNPQEIQILHVFRRS